MKRILGLVLAGLLFAGVAHATCLRTGFQSDVTALVDTVFFDDDQGATSLRFAAHYLWIKLDEDASGPVIIQRGIRLTATTFKFLDDAQTIIPGGHIDSNDENIYCFKRTKTAATDEVDYSASNCALTSMDTSDAAILAALNQPTPVAVSPLNDLVTGLTLRDSTGCFWTGSRTYPLTAGADISGAKAILLKFSWTTWKSGGVNAFTLYNVFSATGDDTAYVTGINNTAMPDSIDCGDSTGVWKGQDLKNVNGKASILIPIGSGAGNHFVKIKPHSKTMHIYNLNIQSLIVR